MPAKPFSAFKKGAIAMAGLAVAAGFYMSDPNTDNTVNSATAEQVRQALADHRENLYDTMEGVSGGVVLSGEDGYDRLGPMSQQLAAGDFEAGLYSDINIGQAVINYKIQSADLDPQNPLMEAHRLLEAGHEGIREVIETAVDHVVANGFMGDNLSLMHSDPEGFANDLRGLADFTPKFRK